MKWGLLRIGAAFLVIKYDKSPALFLLRVNAKGRIVSGEMKGWYVCIQDDLNNTGEFLFIQSPNHNFSGVGFDNWFDSIEDVEKHITRNDLKIDWD
jgi:hypothetical protein